MMPLQLGDGANDKNAGLGLSHWFSWSVAGSAPGISFVNSADGRHGDVNLNLTAVPLPAAGLLLLGAIGALGAVRRRKI